MTGRPCSNLLKVEHIDQSTVVTILGPTVLDDDTISQIGTQLLHLAEQTGAGQLVLNCGNVEQWNSLLLAKLIALHKRMQAAGGELVLYNLDQTLCEILQTTGLDRFFTVAETKGTPTRSVRVWEDRTQANSTPLLEEGRRAKRAEPAGPLFFSPLAPLSAPLVGGDEPQEVALCDPQPKRAANLVSVLGRDVGIVHFADLDTLARYCQRTTPAAVVLALYMGNEQFERPGTPAQERDRNSSALRPSPDVLSFIRAHAHRLPLVVYAPSSRLPIEVYCQPLAAGARQVVNEEARSFPEDMRLLLGRLVSERRGEQTRQGQLTALFAQHGLIGCSPALQEVFRRAIKASQFSDLPVLLVGPTGTGKQRLAEAIHNLDARRRGKPFLTLNCSALSKNLAESELFGHTRGAFSGAQEHRLGLFRAAEGGTLLLDEIGELDPELQPKLLRVLQEYRLLPVGEDYEHPLDVRIIAATNRPLEELIAQGKFRTDLYQRLHVFQISIPPLCERREDIALQAQHFLKLYQSSGPTPVTEFGPRVLEALELLPWEGNTRQLQNVIREALAHKERGTVLQMEDLPHRVHQDLAELPPPTTVRHSLDSLAEVAWKQGLSLNQAVEEYERRLLHLVLQQNAGNRTKTASDLGLTPRTIFNKIKKYQLE